MFGCDSELLMAASMMAMRSRWGSGTVSKKWAVI